MMYSSRNRAVEIGLGLKRFLTHHSIWNVVVLAAVFALLFILLIIDERRVALEQTKTTAHNLVSAVGRDISRNSEIIDLTLQKLIHRIQQPDFAERDPVLQRQLLLDQVATARYFSAIGVTDANAKVLYHSRATDPSAIEIGGFEYFTVHRDRPDASLFISLPIKSRHGYGWALVFSRRLSNHDGSFAGIAYVALSLDYFTDLFERMELGQGGSMTLLRADGRLLARVPESEKGLGTNVRNAGIYHHFPQKRSGSFEVTSPFDGVRRLVTYTQVGHFPLTVSVGRSLESIYANWRHRAITIGSIVLVLTGAMIALALNVRRQMQRRYVAHQEALRNEALFRGAVKGAGISTALLDLDERVITINRAYTDMFGYTKDDAVGLSPRQFAFRGDPAPDNGALLRGETNFEEKEYRFRCKDGTVLWVLRSASLIRDEVGRPAFLHVQYQDITARREAEESLRYAATHDALTGLLNRVAFEEKITKALEESQETGIKHTLAFLDLDRLKIINDTEGHAAGDAMLQWVATALPAYMRKGDIIGRLGGDEFGIILIGCSIEDATEVLKRLNRATSAIQFPWGERSFSVGASIGLAEITKDADSPSDPGSGRCGVHGGQDRGPEPGEHLPAGAERCGGPPS
jgi:diguanylate cyclase (GGDEF)-like protein/PAS domain S-box-containing protein